MADLTMIETAARVCSTDIYRLNEMVAERNNEIEIIKDKYDLNIQKQSEVCIQSMKDLHNYIAQSPQLFEDPKTRVIGVLRYGYTKKQDTLTYDDDAVIIDRIKSLIPESYKELTNTKVSLAKSVLNKLNVEELRILGIKVVEGKDEPTINYTDTDIAKLMKDVEKGAEVKSSNS